MSSRWNNKIPTLTLVLAPLFKASEFFYRRWNSSLIEADPLPTRFVFSNLLAASEK